MELLQIKCPTCHSAVLQSHTTYTTKSHGRKGIEKCVSCPVYFYETKNTLMEGLKTPISVIWQVVKARTEGVAYLRAADNVSGPLPYRLGRRNQLVIHPPNQFSIPVST